MRNESTALPPTTKLTHSGSSPWIPAAPAPTPPSAGHLQMLFCSLEALQEEGRNPGDRVVNGGNKK